MATAFRPRYSSAFVGLYRKLRFRSNRCKALGSSRSLCPLTNVNGEFSEGRSRRDRNRLVHIWNVPNMIELSRIITQMSPLIKNPIFLFAAVVRGWYAS